MQSKNNELRQAKEAAREGDRHNIVPPTQDSATWARTLSTQRVADLFKTPDGLDGHWQQIQQEVNAGNHHFFRVQDMGQGYNDGGATSIEGKTYIAWIAKAIIKAAEDAKFDFELKKMKFTSDMAWLKLSRQNGKVIVHSSPV